MELNQIEVVVVGLVIIVALVALLKMCIKGDSDD
jgi:hypothetical protein